MAVLLISQDIYCWSVSKQYYSKLRQLKTAFFGTLQWEGWAVASSHSYLVINGPGQELHAQSHYSITTLHICRSLVLHPKNLNCHSCIKLTRYFLLMDMCWCVTLSMMMWMMIWWSDVIHFSRPIPYIEHELEIEVLEQFIWKRMIDDDSWLGRAGHARLLSVR